MTLRVWRWNARRKRRWNYNNLLGHWGQSQISPVAPIQFKPVHITWLRQGQCAGSRHRECTCCENCVPSIFWLEVSPTTVSSSWDLESCPYTFMLLTREQTAIVAVVSYTERLVISRTKKMTGIFLLLSFTISDLVGDLHLFFHPKPLCSADANLAVYWSLESFGNLHGQNCIFLVKASLDSSHGRYFQALNGRCFLFSRLLWFQWRTNWTRHRWNCNISRTLSGAMKGWLKPTQHR